MNQTNALNLFAIAAWVVIGLALPPGADAGVIFGWGYDSYGETVPPAGDDFIAIAAGDNYSVALRDDGSLTGWAGKTGLASRSSTDALIHTQILRNPAGEIHSGHDIIVNGLALLRIIQRDD